MAHDHTHHAAGPHGGQGIGPHLATGAMIVASRSAGRGALGRLLTHPLIMFALGATAGYFAYKYRQEIIDAAMRASEMGKDYVMNTRETLEDLMEEAKERAEGGQAGPGPT
jgi:hypothetical protein